MKKLSSKFAFAPADFIPFRDTKVIARVRRIKREDITKHRNPDFRITVMPDAEVEFLWITDMFFRIKDAMEASRPFVAIMPNPWPGYVKLSAAKERTSTRGARQTDRNLGRCAAATSHPRCI